MTDEEKIKALKLRKILHDKKIQNKHPLDGCIPSPDDPRDYTIEQAGVAGEILFPEEYRTEGEVDVLNQGSVSSCVPHAIAAAMGYGEFKGGFDDYHDFSRGFIYANRKSTNYQGEGMVTREALKQLNHCGDCMYEDFPYNKTYSQVKRLFEADKDDLLEKASPYAVVSYFKCKSTEDVKLALMNQGAVIACIPIYDGFGEYIEMPADGEKASGSHAVCCVGWNKDGWIIQNSWGTSWGDKGFCYMPFEYPVTEWWGIVVNENVPAPETTKWYDVLWTWLKKAWEAIKDFFKSIKDWATRNKE